MSGRSYLSIGDVLTLLRREFPDVTISKIRFLESQGLVNPERTPSGYRKFYEQDVERLRWVLRQQREHFLPLKVIKGRLEEETPAGGGNGTGIALGQHRRSGRHPSSGTGETRTPERASPVLVGLSAPGTEGIAGGSQIPPTGLGAESLGARSPQHREDALYISETLGEGLQSLTDRSVSEVDVPVVATHSSGSVVAKPSTEPGAPGRSTEPGAPGRNSLRTPAVETDASATEAETVDVGGAASIRTVIGLSGTSMTVEELAGASGLQPAEIRQLESFCLLAGRTIGGETYYDEDALMVARVAGAFARHGVEARHLRLHLLAAQREAGFIEQVVLPLLKQRNPTSRQRAHELVDELSRMGQELRALLLRARLREQLGV